MDNENIGSATAAGINLEKILAEVKECNYNLVNAITATEAIQKEKEALENELNNTGFIKDEKRIKKLQYNIALQTEVLMKTLMKLDSISITGHIKHSHKIKKERKKEKKQEQFEDDLDFSSDSRSRSGSNSTTNTSSSNFSSESESDSSGSDGSGSDSDDYIPKFSPHRLRKYRKQLVNRIMRLIDYIDVLSNETKELKSKYEKSKVNNNNTTTNTGKPQEYTTKTYEVKPPGYHQHKNERKPTIGQSRHSNGTRNFDPYSHQRQSSYDFDSPFEFKEFNSHLNNDNLYPFGDEEENQFDSDNFESPSSTLNRYRSNSNSNKSAKLFKRN